ncbi:MAG: hypothetical protein GY701_21005 [Sulfitobacter sp.]|nr:hypothetical protein [Sulfitobacter sp.]
MIALIIILLLMGVTLAITLTYLLGFRLGSHYSSTETQRVRAQAAAAQRQLHDLTRVAFVAMAEEARRRRFDNG